MRTGSIDLPLIKESLDILQAAAKRILTERLAVDP